MNIIIDIAHPAHVHLLRNFFYEMTAKGHKVVVTCKHIPSAMQLLDIYNIPYIYLGKKKDNIILKAFEQIKYNSKLLRIARREQCTIGIGTSITLAHIAALSKLSLFRSHIHAILLDDDDDEVEPLYAKYGHPLADVVLSPKDTPRASHKTIYYPAYHELAYLHPKHFIPDISVLDDAGIRYQYDSDGRVTNVEPYFVMRFNAFKAHHDVGVVGLTIENKRSLVKVLSQHGKVFITTERDIDEEFKQYQLRVPQNKVHSLLYYSTMFVGDSQTMTSEAAVLGTPAIRCNTFVGRIHYLEEEEHKYGLTYGFLPNESERMFERIKELLEQGQQTLKNEWQKRRDIMLRDKIDYTDFLVWFVENWPYSVEETKFPPQLRQWLNLCKWVKFNNHIHSCSFSFKPKGNYRKFMAKTNEDVMDLTEILTTIEEYKKHPLCNMECILMGWQQGLLDVNLYVDQDDNIVGGTVSLKEETWQYR